MRLLLGKDMREAGKTLVEARAFAVKLSRSNPGQYVTLYACFGIFARMAKRLHVCTPSDSILGVYWLNGKERPFTSAQHGADQRATPALL